VSHTNYETIITLVAQITKDGKAVNEVPVEISDTPQMLIDSANFMQLPLMIYGKAINKVIFEHGLTPNILKRLCKIVENPAALYHPDRTNTVVLPGTVVILTNEILNGDRLIVAVQPSINVGHKIVNRVASIYGKPQGVIDGWGQKGLKI